jgi:hypothetical protein
MRKNIRQILLYTFVCLLFLSNVLSFPSAAQQENEVDKKEAVSYDLPYPGILPDHPLYPVKMFRDRFVSMFLSDPVKIAEFNLLQADKRLQAGVSLLNKNQSNVQLALSTISKGQHYFTDAVESTKDAKAQGFYTGDITHKMSLAAKKHSEVIVSMEKKVPGRERNQVAQFKKQIEKIENDVSSFSKR